MFAPRVPRLVAARGSVVPRFVLLVAVGFELRRASRFDGRRRWSLVSSECVCEFAVGGFLQGDRRQTPRVGREDGGADAVALNLETAVALSVDAQHVDAFVLWCVVLLLQDDVVVDNMPQHGELAIGHAEVVQSGLRGVQDIQEQLFPAHVLSLVELLLEFVDLVARAPTPLVALDGGVPGGRGRLGLLLVALEEVQTRDQVQELLGSRHRPLDELEACARARRLQPSHGATEVKGGEQCCKVAVRDVVRARHALEHKRQRLARLLEQSHTPFDVRVAMFEADKPITSFFEHRSTDMYLALLFESAHYAVINKPVGIGSHAIVQGSDWRLCHRLDDGTSGCLLVAKSRQAAGVLCAKFRQRQVRKLYVALTASKGTQGTMRGDMRKARRGAWKLTRNCTANCACTDLVTFGLGPTTQNDPTRRLVVAKPFTGRTHQVRCAAKAAGNVIYGDSLYGGPKADRLYLHAAGVHVDLPGGPLRVINKPQGGLFATPRFDAAWDARDWNALLDAEPSRRCLQLLNAP